MSHVIHQLVQGSPEWHAYRRTKFNASDAAAMLGKSQYIPRTELLAFYATGAEREVSPDLQKRFDDGHAYEAQARPLAEAEIGDELFPITASLDVEGLRLPLSASYDGVTMDEDTIFEHKSMNADLEAALTIGEIPEEYWYQMEQQLLVIGASRVLFMASRGTPESALSCWYESRPEIRARLLAGWKQFQADIENYQAPEVIPAAAVARTMEDLPAVSVKVDGSLAVASNLDVFRTRLGEFIATLNQDPDDDQGFADAERAVKVLDRAEQALSAAENQALAQVTSVDQLVKTIAALRETARATRLRLEKVVKSQKEVVRTRIVASGKDRLAEHLAALRARLGGHYMPAVPADFAGVVKGKRTIASLREAVDAELTRAKLDANAIADMIQINLATLAALDERHQNLFADRATLVVKSPEDCAAAIKLRCSEFDAKEQRRLDEERERIRKEEAARVEREAQARIDAERREREAAEQQARANAAPPAKPTAAAPLGAEVLTAAPPVSVPANFTKRPHTPPAPAPITAMTRPTDDQIIEVLALHFRVHESKVIEWLLDMDVPAASNRMAAEFLGTHPGQVAA